LAAVNNTLAEFGTNIEGQLLATRGEIGYVVTDTDASVELDALNALKNMEQYIRIRVLPPIGVKH
jgi:D-3-phosphoglycerate dehydrogenase